MPIWLLPQPKHAVIFALTKWEYRPKQCHSLHLVWLFKGVRFDSAWCCAGKIAGIISLIRVWWCGHDLDLVIPVGRSQAVLANEGVVSNWTPTSIGIPQGSVLGPLFFLIFIGDIGACLAWCDHVIYADDLHISCSCPPSALDTTEWHTPERRQIKYNVRWQPDSCLCHL